MDENILEETAYEERAADLAAEVDFYADADIDLDLDTPETDDMDADEEDGFYESQQDYLDYLATCQAEYDDQWGDSIDLRYGY